MIKKEAKKKGLSRVFNEISTQIQIEKKNTYFDLNSEPNGAHQHH